MVVALAVVLCHLPFSNVSAQVKLGVKAGIDASEMSFSGDVFKKSNRMGYFIGPVLSSPCWDLDLTFLPFIPNGMPK